MKDAWISINNGVMGTLVFLFLNECKRFKLVILFMSFATGRHRFSIRDERS